MSGRAERLIDKAIKYGAVFAEVGPPFWGPAKR